MTDVRIIPNLSILPGANCSGNQASSAETGVPTAAVFAEPEALADSQATGQRSGDIVSRKALAAGVCAAQKNVRKEGTRG